MTGDSTTPGGGENRHPTGNQRGGDTAELGTIFELLACRYCRFTLYRLHGSEGAIEFEDLVEYVATIGNSEDGKRDSVRRVLRDVHLPRLAETDVVDYDARSGSIRYRERPALVEWLEHARYKELESY